MAEAFATANADPAQVPAMVERIEAIDRSITRRQARQAELLAIAQQILLETKAAFLCADDSKMQRLQRRLETATDKRTAVLVGLRVAVRSGKLRQRALEIVRHHPLIADLQRQIGTNEAREKARHSMRFLNAGKRDYAEKQAIVGLAKRAGWLLRTLEPGQVLTVLRAEGNRERIAVGALRYAQGRAL